jgi:hypothetical protein
MPLGEKVTTECRYPLRDMIFRSPRLRSPTPRGFRAGALASLAGIVIEQTRRQKIRIPDLVKL